MCNYVLFFFSSRRRHTRLTCDWSSDVCSSDLLPAFGIKLEPFTAGVIGLTVNYAAYLSEVYRAGIQAVAKGQLEAAQALGMSRTLMMRLIILPQAIRIIVPPLGNYFISLFKDTALASIITVKELLFTGQI